MMTKMSGGDAEKIKQSPAIFAECSQMTDPDPCEAAGKMGACIMMNTKKLRIDADM